MQIYIFIDDEENKLVGIVKGGNCLGGNYAGWELSLVRVIRARIVRCESCYSFTCCQINLNSSNKFECNKYIKMLINKIDLQDNYHKG